MSIEMVVSLVILALVVISSFLITNWFSIYRLERLRRFMAPLKRRGIDSFDINNPGIRIPRSVRKQLSYRASPAAQNYDLFVSYRSGDIDNVRTVIDYVIAAGLKVWFAEYNLLLFNQTEYTKEIETAISRSKFATCFLSDDYFSSSFCTHEFQAICDAPGLGMKKTLLIKKLSMDGQSDGLLRCHEARAIEVPFEFGETEPARAALNALEELMGQKIPKPPRRRKAREQDKRTSFEFEDIRFVVNHPHWSLDSRSTKRGNGLVGRAIWMHSDEAEHRSHAAFVPGWAADEISVEKFDNWQYRLKFTKDFAFFFFPAQKEVCLGVHLFKAFGSPQIAFTTLKRRFDLFSFGFRDVWCRKYIVHAIPSGHNRVLEIVIDYYFYGSFQEFIKNSFPVNRFVGSLAWE